MDWKGRPVLVTGGASFIGSHVDDLSSGRIENIQTHVGGNTVDFTRGDLRDQDVTRHAVDGMSVVFHLAADHGGRGYVDLHQAACASNLMLDGLVFHESRKAGVEKVVY